MNNTPKIIIREVLATEIPFIHNLCKRVFQKNIAPTLSAKGIDKFNHHVIPCDKILNRLEKGNKIYVAFSERTIVGMSEIRSPGHLGLLFIDDTYQKRGIGQQLIHQAMLNCKQLFPQSTHMTVNSALQAIRFYEKLGFVASDKEQEEEGLRFLPMKIRNEV